MSGYGAEEGTNDDSTPQTTTNPEAPWLHPVAPTMQILSSLFNTTTSNANSTSNTPPPPLCWVGEWDREGVYVYQAFKDSIADYAVEHKRLGGPDFKTKRMTWVKPSFGWVLYRSGYGSKPGQSRVLKLKVPHDVMARILSHGQVVDTNKVTRSEKAVIKRSKEVTAGRRRRSGKNNDDDDDEEDDDDASGESEADDEDINRTADEDFSVLPIGRVQWDPERDLFSPAEKGREPRAMLRRRAIQIGLQGRLSEYYVAHTIDVQDVTHLARRVGDVHKAIATAKGSAQKKAAAAMMEQLISDLPSERPYYPSGCSEAVLVSLGMKDGATATAVGRLGRGMATGGTN